MLCLTFYFQHKSTFQLLTVLKLNSEISSIYKILNPSVVETCSTREKTNELKVALKTVILSVKLYISMQQDAQI
jgi:hypothetical protein